MSCKCKGFPTWFDYKVFVAEYIPLSGETFDIAEWIREFGKDGWQLIELSMGGQDSGMVTADKQPIKKVVIQAVAMKGMFDEDKQPEKAAELPEAA